ncbi:hypothetical protein M2436_001301 [Streptomyces sp. HB372]|nr:hypothetical protein [Streptomyces sp. HB372]
MLGRDRGAGGGALGESVAVADVRAEARAELLHERGRQRRAAGGDHPERGEVVRGDVRMRGQRHEGGGRADGVGGAVGGEGLQDDARLEAVGQDEGARVGDAGGELADHAGDVEERGEREVGGTLGDRVAGALAFGVDHDVAVGVHRALGGAARPGGVADQRHVGGGELPVLGGRVPGAGRGEQVVGEVVGAGGREPLETEDAGVVHALEVQLAGGERDTEVRGRRRGVPQIRLPRPVRADQRGDPGVREDVADLAGLVHRVEGDDGRARLPGAEQREDEVRAVLEHDRDPVAPAQPPGGEVSGHRVGQPVGLPVAQAAVEVGQRRVLGRAPDGVPEGVQHGRGRGDGGALGVAEQGEPRPGGVDRAAGGRSGGGRVAHASLASHFCWRRFIPRIHRSGSAARAW